MEVAIYGLADWPLTLTGEPRWAADDRLARKEYSRRTQYFKGSLVAHIAFRLARSFESAELTSSSHRFALQGKKKMDAIMSYSG